MSLPRLRLSVLCLKSGINKHRRSMITQSRVKFYTQHDNVDVMMILLIFIEEGHKVTVSRSVF